MIEYSLNYGLIVIFSIIALGIPLGMLMVSWLGGFVRLRPSRPSDTKEDPYEGGMKPLGKIPQRVNLRYYYFAILFIAFDVETALVYPIAVRYGVLSAQFGWTVFAAAMVLLLILTLPFIYAWKKGEVNWFKGEKGKGS